MNRLWQRGLGTRPLVLMRETRSSHLALILKHPPPALGEKAPFLSEERRGGPPEMRRRPPACRYSPPVPLGRTTPTLSLARCRQAEAGAAAEGRTSPGQRQPRRSRGRWSLPPTRRRPPSTHTLSLVVAPHRDRQAQPESLRRARPPTSRSARRHRRESPGSLGP